MYEGRHPRILSIGVYGFSEQDFFNRLKAAGVDILCDIRMRRGMRGSKYKFANSNYLQDKLAELGIKYVHVKELAPNDEIRGLQWADDDAKGVTKQRRKQLGSKFIEAYEVACLNRFDAAKLLEKVGALAKSVCFLCVETTPDACHRSLVTARMRDELGVLVEDLLP